MYHALSTTTTLVTVTSILIYWTKYWQDGNPQTPFKSTMTELSSFNKHHIG